MRRTGYSIEVVLVLYAFSGPALWAHLSHEHHHEADHPPASHDVADHRSETPASPRDSVLVAVDLLLDEPITLTEIESGRAAVADPAIEPAHLHASPPRPRAPPTV